MASTPRTKEQILNDYKVIRKAARTARSWKELVSLTGLSHSQIKTTLNYYPVVKQRINEMLQSNSKANCKNDNSGKDADITNGKTRKKVSQYIKRKESTNILDEIKPGKTYVIDISVTNFEYIEELFFRILYSGSKIIITSIVNDELEKLSKRKDPNSLIAKSILRWAVNLPEVFKAVYIIPNENEIPDSCIIRYCQEHKKNTILITADKHMAIDARAKGVKAIYVLNTFFFQEELKNITSLFENRYKKAKQIKQILEELLNMKELHTKSFKPIDILKAPSFKYINDMPRYTLGIADYKNDVLVIKDELFKSDSLVVAVKFLDKLYWKGPLRLYEGMCVYLARKCDDYMILEYYMVTAISSSDNCIRLFSCAVDSKTEFEDELCKEFVREAQKIFNP